MSARDFTAEINELMRLRDEARPVGVITVDGANGAWTIEAAEAYVSAHDGTAWGVACPACGSCEIFECSLRSQWVRSDGQNGRTLIFQTDGWDDMGDDHHDTHLACQGCYTEFTMPDDLGVEYR